MEFSAQQIAMMLGGEILGNADAKVCDVAPIEQAQAQHLSFITDEKYLSFLQSTQAGVVLVTKSLLANTDTSVAGVQNTGRAVILVENARGAIAQLLQAVAEVLNPRRKGIEQPAYIAEGVIVPDDAYIGAFAYIGKNVRLGKGVQIYPQAYVGDNVVIGDNAILYAGAKVYYNCRVGNNCILHSGCVIGADGFGFEPDAKGYYHKVPQIGIVVIEDDVEIGANTTVDRAMMGETRVHRNAKIDNLVQVAHNVRVGESTVLCSQVGIAGSSTVGSHCTLTGQVGVGGHLEIADNCIIGAQSGVPSSITKPGMYLGSPAMDAGLCRRVYAAMRKLPDMYRKAHKS